RELADYVVDRGDLAHALALVRHPDLSPSVGAVALLEELHAETGGALRGVGRNDPCPCGSGRKFKVCCQRDPKVPLRARTRLLVYKLAHFAAADHRRRALVGLATSAADPDSPTLLFDLRELVFDRVIVDLAVFEGGVAAEYLDQRGPLLPADERNLLEVLLDEPRRLWEAIEVDPGTGRPCVTPAPARSWSWPSGAGRTTWHRATCSSPGSPRWTASTR
ncbi:MAG: SEC-C metal-binding domain-containing protein, partial [Acidimicrobiales bacterium]